MSDVTEELAKWLSKLLDPNEPLPDGRPAQLTEALVTSKSDSIDSIPSVKIACEDGSRFGVLVLQMRMNPEQREIAERKAQEYIASGEYNATLLRIFEKDLEQIEQRHSEDHEGPFESCQESECKSIRKHVARLRGEVVPSDEGEDLVH